MAFPLNPNVGDIFITPSGRAYEWISNGAWRVHEVAEVTSAERDSIITHPKSGRVIINVTTGQMEQWTGTAWTAVTPPDPGT